MPYFPIKPQSSETFLTTHFFLIDTTTAEKFKVYTKECAEKVYILSNAFIGLDRSQTSKLFNGQHELNSIHSTTHFTKKRQNITKKRFENKLLLNYSSNDMFLVRFLFCCKCEWQIKYGKFSMSVQWHIFRPFLNYLRVQLVHDLLVYQQSLMKRMKWASSDCYVGC